MEENYRGSGIGERSRFRSRRVRLVIDLFERQRILQWIKHDLDRFGHHQLNGFSEFQFVYGLRGKR